MSNLVLRAAFTHKHCWDMGTTRFHVNPRCRNNRALVDAGSQLYDVFATMHDAYLNDPRGYSTHLHEQIPMLSKVMVPLLVGVYLSGYRDMSQITGKPISPSTESTLVNTATARGHYSADIMVGTTRDRVRSVLDADKKLSDDELWAFSKERADAAVDFEGVRGYQMSSEHSLRSMGGGEWGKAWIIDPDVHDRTDACDENEAAGVIPLGALFPSGVSMDPDHPNCGCMVEYVRMR